MPFRIQDPPPITSEETLFRLRAYNKVIAAIGYLEYLPPNVVNLLVDQEILVATFSGYRVRVQEDLIDIYDGSKSISTYKADIEKSCDDFSFLITPACKAFEGYLIFLA